VNNVNVRSVAQSIGITVEEKNRTNGDVQRMGACPGVQQRKKTGFRRRYILWFAHNPRIVRLFSQSVEIPVTGTLLLLNNTDKPGIVGHLGTLLAKHKVNIASMSLAATRRAGWR